jgi:UDP-glucose 4-epimerase
MAVAVIGGAGFIGSNLVDELMVQGFEVTVLDNLLDGKVENLSRWRGNQKFEFIKGDALDFDTVRRVCDHKDWVFNLAAMARIQPSITDPRFALENNIMASVNILEACRLGEVKRYVYSASSSVTGDNGAAIAGQGQPVSELCERDIKSPYALSKVFGEDLANLYERLYGLSTCALRYFNAYGPRHQESGSYATVVALFRKQLRDGKPITVVGDGSQRRDFTFVGDVVRANLLAAMNYAAKGTYNIGTGTNYSILEVADIVASEMGIAKYEIEYLPERKGEYKATLADNKRAYNELGWKPQVDLKTGLHITTKYESVLTSSMLILPNKEAPRVRSAGPLIITSR